MSVRSAQAMGMLAVTVVVVGAIGGCGTKGTPKAETGGSSATSSTASSSSAPSSAGTSTPAAAAGDTVTFEVTGPGKVYSINTDPSTEFVPEDTPTPFTRTIKVPPTTDLLQVVVTGKDNQGCRILLNDKVVAEQPIGGSGHCIFNR